jgi:hypothetical protein
LSGAGKYSQVKHFTLKLKLKRVKKPTCSPHS